MKKATDNLHLNATGEVSEQDFESLHPHNPQKHPIQGVFLFQSHTSNTLSKVVRRMKPPSEPQIKKINPKRWLIEWNHDVPYELWHKYHRKRMRIIRIGNINEFEGEERERNAEFWRQVWSYSLNIQKYNPFDEELQEFRRIRYDTNIVQEKIQEVAEVIKDESRSLFPIDKALSLYIESREKRKLAESSITAYQGMCDWLNEGLTYTGKGTLPIGKLKYIHISEALDYIAEDREWSATTINKEVGFMMTLFNWLETEEYVLKNPIRGKFVKLPTQKSKHRWYDRLTAVLVKNEAKNSSPKVYLAMEFTYQLLIRSKAELRKLKIGDIDRELKRVRFSADLSKNNQEEYRDYPEELEETLDRLKLNKYPKDYYIFGEDGDPGLKMCSHNFFSYRFKAIKDKLGLSPDYTIYGFKHTRIIHELMKGTDGREISHMARHSDFKTTKEYLRDYDLSLQKIYGPEDLKF